MSPVFKTYEFKFFRSNMVIYKRKVKVNVLGIRWRGINIGINLMHHSNDKSL